MRAEVAAKTDRWGGLHARRLGDLHAVLEQTRRPIKLIPYAIESGPAGSAAALGGLARYVERCGWQPRPGAQDARSALKAPPLARPGLRTALGEVKRGLAHGLITQNEEAIGPPEQYAQLLTDMMTRRLILVHQTPLYTWTR
ncbi:hypothetical protein [Streptomyces sp. NPDC007088]|uniref:hypothetical protein n=1 Tax=Streptomyces sp. NPDC007088 TaxID=3364773 RepID=UPI00367ACCA8